MAHRAHVRRKGLCETGLGDPFGGEMMSTWAGGGAVRRSSVEKAITTDRHLRLRRKKEVRSRFRAPDSVGPDSNALGKDSWENKRQPEGGLFYFVRWGLVSRFLMFDACFTLGPAPRRSSLFGLFEGLEARHCARG